MVAIAEWLASLGLERYAERFVANDIDERALPHLGDADLRELGLSLGHRRILLAAINRLTSPAEASPSYANQGTSGTAVSAERRQLTVMFCDLVGSTELAHRLDPEDMRDVLRAYQDAVAEAVIRYDGYVAKFLGDGVLAYFGWPRAYEDQAERAVRAALDVLRGIEAVTVAGGHGLRARLGIATGQVVVGDLVGDATVDAQTVVGETPNLAARLQVLAAPGQIVISRTTRDLVGRLFELTDLGRCQVKGFKEPVRAWRVNGEGPLQSRFKAARGSELTALIGREHELGLLQERWRLASEGEGQVVLLAGEAGIGKSRLVLDLKNQIPAGSFVGLSYQCSAHHTNSAFHPVVQQLRRVAGFAPEDSGDVKLAKLEAWMAAAGVDVGQAPVLAALLGLAGEQRYGPLDCSPQQLRGRIIALLCGLVVAQSERLPVLCVIEDAHWSDPSMIELIGAVLPRLADARVCLLITHRPEFTPPWPGHAHVSWLVLNRLGRRQAAQIVRQLAGAALPAALVEQIAARSDGVPLYAEELTRSVLEGIGADDLATLTAGIPTSLQSSLVARLDRLGDAKATAQVGAVIGREFRQQLLAALLERPAPALEADLERLTEAGLIVRRGEAEDASYAFKHALVQDAAYGTILLRRRQQLHARIIELVEAETGPRSIERVDTLAHHACQAEQWDKAFGYLQLAGRKAMDRSALHEAAAQFEHALRVSAYLPRSKATLERAIDLRFELRNALWALGRCEAILSHLGDAERLATELDDPARQGWIGVFEGASLWQLGRAEQALQRLAAALAVAERTGDRPLTVAANFYLGCVRVTAGDLAQAEARFARVVDQLQGELRKERCGLPFAPVVIARSWLVWVLAERGAFDAGLAQAEQAIALAEELKHPFNLAHIYYDLGYLHIAQGTLEQAVEALHNSHRLITSWGLTYLSPFVKGFLGHALAVFGQVGPGIELLREAQAAYEAMGLGLFRALVHCQLAEALLLDGQVDAARSLAEHGVALARQRGERGHEAHGLRILGDVAGRADPAVARQHYTAALALADRLGMRPLGAQLRTRLTERAQGQLGSDQAELRAPA